MSTKTLRKRIALVAVTALGAGLVSVAPANAAVTANSLVAATVIGTGERNALAGVANATAVAGVMNIATAPSTDGTTSSSTKSIGLINVSTTAGDLVAGTTQTATLLSSGTLTVYTAATSRYTNLITVENGTIVGTANATAFSSDMKSTAANNAALAASIKPNAGATTMTVRMYVTNGYSTGTTPWTSAELLGGDTSGILTGQISVTIASTSTSGVLAGSKSGSYFVAAYNTSGATSDAAGYTGAADNDGVIFLNTRVRDSFSSAITSSGLLSVTATGGAVVKLNPASATDTGTQASDFEVTASPDNTNIAVSNPGVTPIASTITVTWSGTVIATRTVGFSGEVAKIVLSGAVIGKTSGTGSTNNVVNYSLFDAAGNQLYVDYGGTDNANTPPSGIAGNSALYGTQVSAVTHKTDSSIDLSTGVVTKGVAYFTCGSTSGSAAIGLTYTNLSGTIVTSAPLTVNCAGKGVTYKASYDKAKYTPGEVATLTVQFYDSKGNKANDIDDVDTNDTGEITVSTSGVTAIAGPGTAGTDGANIDQGALTFTYAVGTSEGTFTNKISVPDINTYAGTVGVTTTDTIATLTIAANSTAVSNADVLKAIVSLIASINKQIAALQKALLRR